LTLGQSDEDPADIVGESPYAFFLIPNVWAAFGAVWVVVFQFSLLFFLHFEIKDDENAVAVTTKIPGFVSACMLLALGVLLNIGKGIELVWKGFRYPWKKLFKPCICSCDWGPFYICCLFCCRHGEGEFRIEGLCDNTENLPKTNYNRTFEDC